MEHLCYHFLEKLKDRMIQSTKYTPVLKILQHIPHVVVFSNEPPDETKLSQDRFIIHNM